MNRPRGFTLLEVLLAVALVMMLAGAMGAFVWNLLDRRGTLQGLGRDVHAASALLDRIESDLLSAIAGDAAAGSGVSGSSHRLSILTRGVWIDVGTGDSRADGRRAADLQRSEYRFEPSSARVLAAARPAVQESAGVEFQVVSERVERLRLRYFDGREWLDSFDSLDRGELPVAVEVAIWLAPPGAAPQSERAEVVTAVSGGLSAAEPGSEDEPGLDGEPFAGQRWPRPDRLRLIVVPDGPVTAWRDR